MGSYIETLEELERSNLICLALLLLFCFLFFGLPLLYGVPSGFDMITDIRFATALRDGLSSGHLFPGWANDNFGFGSVGIRFYPPIAMYTLAFADMVVGDWFGALWLNLLFWMVLGSAGMYFFVKEWGGPLQGLLAGVTYAIVPQHLNEIFQFFLYAEFAAWGITPFCFLFVTRICRNGTWKDVVLFSISYSLLILTHIPTTIIISFCLPVYVLIVLDWRNFKPIAVRLAGAIGLTLAATSFRLVTLAGEYNLLAHNNEKYANGFFEYAEWLFPNVLAIRNHFLYVLTSWLFDLSIVMTVCLTIPAIIWLAKTYDTKSESIWRIQAAAVATTWFAFFMLSRPSQFIWDRLAFLQKIQFPWRWLSVLAMCAVLAFSLAVPRLLAVFKNRERFVVYPALALIVTIILFNITQIIIPSAPIPKAEFVKVEKKIAEEPMFEGWWPIWAKYEAFDNAERVTSGDRSITITKWESEVREFSVAKGDSMSLRIATFYYPYWKATLNGQPAEVSRDENGVITVPVQAETTKVRLYFEEPVINRLASYVSLTAWILLLFVIGAGLVEIGRTGRTRNTLSTTGPA